MVITAGIRVGGMRRVIVARDNRPDFIRYRETWTISGEPECCREMAGVGPLSFWKAAVDQAQCKAFNRFVVGK